MGRPSESFFISHSVTPRSFAKFAATLRACRSAACRASLLPQ
jgi:hypothetical protein